MKVNKLYLLLFILLIVGSTSCKDDEEPEPETKTTTDPTTGPIWTGEKMTFTKAINTDATIAANQDRITNNVWITRGARQGIYNAKSESGYTDFSSPASTLWAIGTTADTSSLVLQDWETTVSSDPPSSVNKDMVLYLVTEKQWIDIKFTSWSQGDGSGGGSGGGFSYIRSTR